MYTVQMTKALAHVPLRLHNTGSSKHSLKFGVDALATELDGDRWGIRGGQLPEVQSTSSRDHVLRPHGAR